MNPLTLILIWGITNLVLSVTAFFKVKKNPKGCDFIWWWAFLTGSFVWEDILVFGLLHFLIAISAVLLNDPKIFYVGFLVFWIVRSAGETLYFFLQQFIEPKHHPHEIHSHFVGLRKVLGNISDQKAFILLQITMQSVMVLSLVALLSIL